MSLNIDLFINQIFCRNLLKGVTGIFDTKTGVRCDHISNYDAQWDDELPEISPSLDCHSTQSSESRLQTVDSLLELRVTHNDLVMPDTCSDTTAYSIRHIGYIIQHMHTE